MAHNFPKCPSRKKLENFLKINKEKKFVVLDIPLYLENRLDKKKDIIIFVEADKKKIRQKRMNLTKNTVVKK